MKGKLLLCGTLTTLFCANSFAMEIYKGRIIEHKEWTTGNAKITFKPSDAREARLKFDQQKKQSQNAGAFISTYADSIKGNVGQPITVTGSHIIDVRNDTQATQRYTYILSLCTNTSNHQAQCGYYYDTVELESGGYIFNSYTPMLQVQFDNAGTYTNYAQTLVHTSLESNSSNFNLEMNSNSNATITISDSSKAA